MRTTELSSCAVIGDAQLAAQEAVWPLVKLATHYLERILVEYRFGKSGLIIVSRSIKSLPQPAACAPLFCLFPHIAFDRFAIMAYIHGMFSASWATRPQWWLLQTGL
jgi:hypothetical protein